ncbi:hypothetical protein, conserved, partial [Plasmodium ovale curtisi]
NIYKNKIKKLNNKLEYKNNEIEKLKKQYVFILEDIDNCKKEANNIVKNILNKKNNNLIDKQCFEISKYYEIEINTLKKEINVFRDLVKKEAKEKILLNRKICELEKQTNHNMLNQIGQINSEYDEIKMEEKKKIIKVNQGICNDIIPGCNKIDARNSHDEVISYKEMYERLVNEMRKIKRDFDHQRELYDKKIEQMEQNQEIQNMRNQLNASEKIVQVYQHIFRENVNYIKTDNIQKNDFSEHMDEQNRSKENNQSYICSIGYKSLKSSNNMNGVFNSKKNNYEDLDKSGSLFLQSDSHKTNSPSDCYYMDDSNREMVCRKNDTISNTPIFNIPFVAGNSEMHTAMNKIPCDRYLSSFVRMYVENIPLDDSSDFLKTNINELKKKKEKIKNSDQPLSPENTKIVYNDLLNYEKMELINIFVNICNDLKTDSVFCIVQFVKFLSFIVYEQFPHFTSFYHDVASLTTGEASSRATAEVEGVTASSAASAASAAAAAFDSAKFGECVNIIKKWKNHYIHGQKFYLFRRNVLLIFQADLKDVRKNEVEKKCLDLMKSMYQRNLEMSKYSNDSLEKAEYIINKHSKEIISKVIKTYMNLYSIEKINKIIPHMNSMHSKLKTQSYFIRSISTCLNLNKTDNFQEIGSKIKELTTTQGISDKLKNRINIDEIDEYLAAYTIMGTLKKYLNITHTKDLLPSISKIIQKSRLST